jgi:excisionase family DNA binding protein
VTNADQGVPKVDPGGLPDDLMTMRQAQEYLHLSRTTMYKLCNERRVRFFRLGHRLVFRRRDLDVYVESCAVEPITAFVPPATTTTGRRQTPTGRRRPRAS